MSLTLIREQLELLIDDTRDEIAELCAAHAASLEVFHTEHQTVLAGLQAELERAVNALAALDGDVRAESFDADCANVAAEIHADIQANGPSCLSPDAPTSTNVGFSTSGDGGKIVIAVTEVPVSALSVRSAEPEPKRGGPPRTRPLAEVAEVAGAAIAAGGFAIQALRGHWPDTPDSTLKNWLQAARSEGLVPAPLPVLEQAGTVGKPEIGAPKRSAARARSKYNYARVAEVATAAVTAGKPMTAAVVAEFGVSSAMASQLVLRARLDGHVIPAARALRPTSKPGPKADDVADAVDLVALEADLRDLEAVDPVVNLAAKRLAAIGASPEPPPLRKVRQPAPPMEWPKHTPTPPVTFVDLTIEDAATDPVVQLERCKLTLERVARIYLECREVNVPAVKHLSERFHVHRTVANRWVGLAREASLLPGRDVAQLDPDAPANVLAVRP